MDGIPGVSDLIDVHALVFGILESTPDGKDPKKFRFKTVKPLLGLCIVYMTKSLFS